MRKSTIFSQVTPTITPRDLLPPKHVLRMALGTVDPFPFSESLNAFRNVPNPVLNRTKAEHKDFGWEERSSVDHGRNWAQLSPFLVTTAQPDP